jgi:DNA-binding transcriptional MerR regulator
VKNSLATKLYYSISEVAEITGLQPYTLRAWEKEFSCLRPRRARGKNRAYRERDIGIIQLIKQLLYDEGYTTKGVKQKLKNEPELLQANSEIRSAQKVVEKEKDGGNTHPEESPVALVENKIAFEQPEAEERFAKRDAGTDKSATNKDALREAIDAARSELREILKML